MARFGTVKNINWFATTSEGAKKLSQSILSGSDTRLLFHLLSKIDYDNRSKYNSYKKLSEETGMSVPTIKKAMMNLRNEEIIAKDIEIKKTIFFNPDFFYAGDYHVLNEKKDYFNECQEYHKKALKAEIEPEKNEVDENYMPF